MALTSNQKVGLATANYPEAEATEAVTRTYEAHKAYFTDAGTAANAQTEETIFRFDATRYPKGAKVVGIFLAPGIAVTANDTNYKRIRVYHRTSAYASATLIATLSTLTSASGGTGNLTAGLASDLSSLITAANAVIPAGGHLTYVIDVNATSGVAFNGAANTTAKSLLEVQVLPL